MSYEMTTIHNEKYIVVNEVVMTLQVPNQCNVTCGHCIYDNIIQ